MPNKIPFASQAAILDQYIHSKNPGENPEIANLILTTIQDNQYLHREFFAERPNPAWIPLLWDAGFFAKQPEPEVTTEGIFVAYWYAHEYLLAVAGDAPDYLIKHINENLDSCDSWYKARAIVSLTQLEPKLVSTVVPKILEWLNTPLGYLGNEASNLLLFMADKNYVGDAFSLFSMLITPILKPNIKQNTIYLSDSIVLHNDFPLQKHRYVNNKNEFLDVLEKLDIDKLIKILDSNLREALRKEAEVTTGEDIYRTSHWRHAIEDSEQNLHDSARDLLLRGLRDSVDHHIAQLIQIGQEPSNNYLDDEFSIFRRLGIFLLQKYPKEFQHLVVNELMNFANLDKSEIHHEFFHLLKTGFPILNQIQQATLINAILGGPPSEKLENIAQALIPYSEKDIKDYSEHWIKVRLMMIKEYLIGDVKKVLDNLIELTGEPENPDYLSWMSAWEKIDDISPLKDDELKAMTANNLYEYIQTWVPDPKKNRWSQRESWIGLAARVAEIVIISPRKYLSHLFLIARYRPEFSQTIFGHLSNENLKIPKKDWSIWVELIENLITDINNTEWAEVYRAIIRLLKHGLEHEKSTLPTTLLPKIRNILLILIDNSDPNTEKDRPQDGWFGKLDPLTTSMNHIRPMALETLILYAQTYVQKSKTKDDARKIKWERTVKKAFSRKLDRMADPSWSVHSIYGRYFPYFYWLDQEWAIENVDLIFPQGDDEQSIWYFISAWDSFIFNTNYRPYLMPVLQQKYVQYIECISKEYRTKSTLERLNRFAAHIVLEYCLGNYTFDAQEGQNSLVVQFINKTNPNIRANVADACCLVFRDNPKYSDRFWPRIKTLWEWRNKEASIHNHSSEYDQEMKEFANLLFWVPENETIHSLWPLLEGLLPHIASRKNSTYDWKAPEKYLLKTFEKEPMRVIQFYKMMYDQLPEQPRWFFYHSDEAKELISKAISSKIPEVKQTTLDLIDNLMRRGDNTFKEFYQTNN